MIYKDEKHAFDGHIVGSMHFSNDNCEDELPKLIGEIKNKDIGFGHYHPLSINKASKAFCLLAFKAVYMEI